MLRLLGIALLVVVIGLAIIFHGEIQQFSDTYLTARDSREFIEAGNYERAITVYADKVKAHPTNIDLALTLGDLYHRKGDLEKAREIYKSLAKRYPNNLEITLAYGRLLHTIPERRNQALELYRNALKFYPQNPQLLIQIGQTFQLAAETPQETRQGVKDWLNRWSIYYYRLAVKLSPRMFQPRFGLGMAYHHTGQTEKAAKSYCNALILNPNSFEARYNLGLVLINMNAYDEAYQQFGESIALLTRQDRMGEAQALAERIQHVKNSVYNQGEHRFEQDASDAQLGELLSPGCLLSTAPVLPE